MTTPITSSSQWSQVLSSSTIVVTDFYADWCGPCKMIAPTFDSLATKYAKPKRITFAKVNVDNQRDVASKYGVSAMPTFLIFKNGSVIKTIKGANPPALTAAVEEAVKLAGNAAPGASFSTGGRKLGGTSLGGSGSSQSFRRPMRWDLNSFINALINFIGLYLVSLISFDPYKAAEASKYNVHAPVAPAAGPGGVPGPNGQRPGAPKATFRTLADLGGD